MKRSPIHFAGRVAVVTGAASGIGRAIALSLARRGCDLALADIDEEGLAVTARMVREQGRDATQHHLNVADRAQVASLPNEVKAIHGRVDVLVNNAGVALGGNFADVSEVDFDWLFDINFHGVVRMTRAFLPLLLQSDDARVVNLSSLFGLVSPPGQAAYSASKFAVRGFSNALRFELMYTSVGVTVVHPGGVATSIAKSARIAANLPAEDVEREQRLIERALRMPPERAGEIIVEAAQHRRDRVIVGNDAKLLAVIERLSPIRYFGIFKRLVRR